MQAARGVHDDDVPFARACQLDRVIGHSGGIGAALAADEIGSGAVGPNLELLLGGRAESVSCAENHRAPVLAQAARELADRRRLARAVDANDQDHARLPAEAEPAGLAEEARGLLNEGFAEIAELAARLEASDELRSRRHADVSGKQRLLQPLPGRVVGWVEGSGRDLLGQRSAALAQRVAQTREESARFRARLRPGGIVAEQLRPGAAHACGACLRSRSLGRDAAGSRWSATIAATPVAPSFHERRQRLSPSSSPPAVASGPRTTS